MSEQPPVDHLQAAFDEAGYKMPEGVINELSAYITIEQARHIRDMWIVEYNPSPAGQAPARRPWVRLYRWVKAMFS